MSATANSGGTGRPGGPPELLPESSLTLLAQLDREIEDLRRAAPPGYEETITSLSQTMREIQDALGLPSVADRR